MVATAASTIHFFTGNNIGPLDKPLEALLTLEILCLARNVLNADGTKLWFALTSWSGSPVAIRKHC